MLKFTILKKTSLKYINQVLTVNMLCFETTFDVFAKPSYTSQ